MIGWFLNFQLHHDQTELGYPLQLLKWLSLHMIPKSVFRSLLNRICFAFFGFDEFPFLNSWTFSRGIEKEVTQWHIPVSFWVNKFKIRIISYNWNPAKSEDPVIPNVMFFIARCQKNRGILQALVIEMNRSRRCHWLDGKDWENHWENHDISLTCFRLVNYFY